VNPIEDKDSFYRVVTHHLNTSNVCVIEILTDLSEKYNMEVENLAKLVKANTVLYSIVEARAYVTNNLKIK